MAVATSAFAAPNRTARFYRPELDVLRLGAFGFVFMAHALPYSPSWPQAMQKLSVGLSNGFAFGVDVFFLLSSYLITELLLRECRRAGKLNVKAFWIRRILRIWPLYFAFPAVAIWVVPKVLPQNFPAFDQAAYALFWGNFALIFHPGIYTVAGILWSVCVEEQFYLLWPLVMSRFMRRLQAIAVGLILVSCATRISLAATGCNGLWTFWSNTPARMDPIAAGALVAILLDGKLPRISTRLRLLAISAGFSIIILCGLVFSRSGWWAVLDYPLATAAAVSLLLGILGAPWKFPGPLIYLGRISYGLYVFHVLALRLANAYVNIQSRGTLVWSVHTSVALAMTIAAASLSYRLWETPFLRLKDRFSIIQSH